MLVVALQVSMLSELIYGEYGAPGWPTENLALGMPVVDS